MSLSIGCSPDFIAPEEDKIHSLKDDEWNQKILEFLGQGRLEDVGQLSRTIHQQIRVQKVVAFKPMWWLSAMNGNRNDLTGACLAYEAIHGAGGAVVHIDPASSGVGDKEYDEDDVEVFHGDRNVLDTVDEGSADATVASGRCPPQAQARVVGSDRSRRLGQHDQPLRKPVGAYPHARRVGNMLFLSGVGPRQPGTNAIPGGPIHDEEANPWPTTSRPKPKRW